MQQLDRDIHAEARRVHEHIFYKLGELRAAQTSKPDINALVDSVYALKEAHATLIDIAKEIKKLYGLLERLTCMAWTMKGDYEPIKTSHCTGSPDVKQTVITPKPGTPEYEQMREFFGVPEGVPFRPHWPTMLDRISTDLVAGKNIPPGCDPSKMMPQYRVTIRNKKGVEPGLISDPELLKKQYELSQMLGKIDVRCIQELLDGIMVTRALEQKQDNINNMSDEEPAPESDEENIF